MLTFAITSGVGLVSIQAGTDGSLYYLARGNINPDGGSGLGFDTGEVYKIRYTGSSGTFMTAPPAAQTGSVDRAALVREFVARSDGGCCIYKP